MVTTFTDRAVADCSIKSRSQDTEENDMITYFFKDKKEGFYIEMGALDGQKFSNTLVLHQCFNWNGLLLEASPVNFEKLKANSEVLRPNARLHYGAVCAPPHSHIQFLGSGGAVGGDIDEMSVTFKKQWHPETSKEVHTRVPCTPMREILQDVKHVDFWSLDVEGSELKVLETTDFINVHFDLIMIESGHHDYEMRQYLFNAGFVECKDAIQRSILFLNKKPSDPTYKCPFGEVTTPSAEIIGRFTPHTFRYLRH